MEEQEVLEGVKKSVLSEEARYFDSIVDQLDADSARAIKRREMQYVDSAFYVRKQLVAGVTEVLNTSTDKKIGVTNLDKNKLPELTNMVLSRVRVAWQVDAGVNPAAVKYVNYGDIPAALLNGELRIMLNDKPVIELPLAKFFNAGSTAISHSIQGENDTVKLKHFKLIKPNDLITIEVRTAEGVALPANNHFVEVQLLGSATRRK